MKDKIGYILAAGHGTRMGDIGKTLPKVLWPVFDKTILELQIDYLKELGLNKIFINTHHKSEIIKKYISEKKLEIKILEEENLLGSGGCFHNLKKHSDSDVVLAVNGDQFFFCKSLKDWGSSSDDLLYALEVNNDYNKLIINNNELVNIEKNPKDRKYLTFSGVSRVNLKKLQILEGESKFFESVLNYKEKKVLVDSSKSIYYDFGTLERYVTSMKEIILKIVNNKPDEFIDFLMRNKALDISKINSQKLSYNSEIEENLKLSNSILIEKNTVKTC